MILHTQEPSLFTHNVLQLYAVVCRLCAVEKLRIGAVIRWHD